MPNRQKARRRLFKDEGDQQPQNTDSEELRRANEMYMKKYNFDFLKEKPLEGDYVWEKCDPTTRLPVPGGEGGGEGGEGGEGAKGGDGTPQVNGELPPNVEENGVLENDEALEDDCKEEMEYSAETDSVLR